MCLITIALTDADDARALTPRGMTVRLLQRSVIARRRLQWAICTYCTSSPRPSRLPTMAERYVGRRDNLGDIFLPAPIMVGGKGREREAGREGYVTRTQTCKRTRRPRPALRSLIYTVLLLQSPHQRHRYRPLHPADRGRRHRGVPHSGRRSQSHRYDRTAPEKISQGTNERLYIETLDFIRVAST